MKNLQALLDAQAAMRRRQKAEQEEAQKRKDRVNEKKEKGLVYNGVQWVKKPPRGSPRWMLYYNDIEEAKAEEPEIYNPAD